jgi:hypothetical protein
MLHPIHFPLLPCGCGGEGSGGRLDVADSENQCSDVGRKYRIMTSSLLSEVTVPNERCRWNMKSVNYEPTFSEARLMNQV